MGNMRKKFVEDRTCSSEDMIADKLTHTHRHAHYSTPLKGEVTKYRPDGGETICLPVLATSGGRIRPRWPVGSTSITGFPISVL